eukprot:4271614-Amphidinium_carterae.2
MQKITSEVILPDFDLCRCRWSGLRETKEGYGQGDRLSQRTQGFPGVDVKNLKSEERPRIIDSRWVWRLNEALYGLKNSPKIWQKHLLKVLVDHFKMNQLKSDACVFKNQSDMMFILSYVDDLLIIREESEVNAFITKISNVTPKYSTWSTPLISHVGLGFTF